MGNRTAVQVQSNGISQVGIFTIDIKTREVLGFLIISLGPMVFVFRLMTNLILARVLWVRHCLIVAKLSYGKIRDPNKEPNRLCELRILEISVNIRPPFAFLISIQTFLVSSFGHPFGFTVNGLSRYGVQTFSILDGHQIRIDNYQRWLVYFFEHRRSVVFATSRVLHGRIFLPGVNSPLQILHPDPQLQTAESDFHRPGLWLRVFR